MDLSTSALTERSITEIWKGTKCYFKYPPLFDLILSFLTKTARRYLSEQLVDEGGLDESTFIFSEWAKELGVGQRGRFKIWSPLQIRPNTNDIFLFGTLWNRPIPFVNHHSFFIDPHPLFSHEESAICISYKRPVLRLGFLENIVREVSLDKIFTHAILRNFLYVFHDQIYRALADVCGLWTRLRESLTFCSLNIRDNWSQYYVDLDFLYAMRQKKHFRFYIQEVFRRFVQKRKRSLKEGEVDVFESKCLLNKKYLRDQLENAIIFSPSESLLSDMHENRKIPQFFRDRPGNLAFLQEKIIDLTWPVFTRNNRTIAGTLAVFYEFNREVPDVVDSEALTAAIKSTKRPRHEWESLTRFFQGLKRNFVRDEGTISGLSAEVLPTYSPPRKTRRSLLLDFDKHGKVSLRYGENLDALTPDPMGFQGKALEEIKDSSSDSDEVVVLAQDPNEMIESWEGACSVCNCPNHVKCLLGEGWKCPIVECGIILCNEHNMDPFLCRHDISFTPPPSVPLNDKDIIEILEEEDEEGDTTDTEIGEKK